MKGQEKQCLPILAPNIYFYFLPLLISLFLLSVEAEETFEYANSAIAHDCGNSTSNSFTKDSLYESNLNVLLSNLSSEASLGGGFRYIPVGRISDHVFGIYLCRADVVAGNISACSECVTVAAREIRRLCPTEKEAVVWYENCLLRYSDKTIYNVFSDLTTVNFRPPANGESSNAAADDDQYFELSVAGMVNSLAVRAASFDSGSGAAKFAAGEQNVSDAVMYGLAQCTPDLSAGGCSRCFQRAIGAIPDCCRGRRRARLLLPSCFIMYDSDRLFDPAVLGAPPPLPVPGKNKRSFTVIVAVVIPVVTALILSMAYYLRRRRAIKKYNALITKDLSGVNIGLSTKESLQFDFKNIETATSKFADFNLLGKGGFGQVYKGMLINGQEIAVKRLSKSSGQGEEEFTNEVILVAKLQHRNLVRLLGFCLEGDEKILVYEYVPNKSLDYFLFDPRKQGQLNWSIRRKIIEGIARGILYLHEDSRLKIIHRDLKASNILLDNKFNPKVSDFGMAKIFGVDQTQGNTNRIVGTYGYMAPEYAMEGHYSIKSDVYSFGVLLLEILSGRRNSSFHINDSGLGLVAHAWELWKESKATELMDSCLKELLRYESEFLKYVHIGLLCVQEDALLRPTMSTLVLMLKSEAQSLPQPERPAFVTRRFSVEHEVIAIHSSSLNEMTVSDFLPR